MQNIFKIVALSLFLLINCNVSAAQLNEKNYTSERESKGVVLVGVNWGRQWNCGKYENAQLRKLVFSLLDSSGTVSNDSIVSLESPDMLNVKAKFLDYGFLVEPGLYAFSEFSVKVAKSVNDVGYIKADSTKLVNGEKVGGKFEVKAGEIAYIGHFFLDCLGDPIPWRYYPEGKEAFEGYSKSVKKQFSYFKDAKIQFRILDTEMFGSQYTLK
ncbi:MAG: hypothetical protein OEZ47_15945 [Gammaproteobacteria bacterium]|nr:hypothetical protein [Gammaproteobacteria bacterium]